MWTCFKSSFSLIITCPHHKFPPDFHMFIYITYVHRSTIFMLAVTYMFISKPGFINQFKFLTCELVQHVTILKINLKLKLYSNNHEFTFNKKKKKRIYLHVFGSLDREYMIQLEIVLEKDLLIVNKRELNQIQ